MSGIPQPNRFRYLGDWLISRSESVLGGFQIGICANIIRQEGLGYRLTDEDIRRILARYKEHVSYWNVGLDVIRSELQMLADAMGRSFFEVATQFDSLEPRRIPPDILFNFARVRKEVFVPFEQNPSMGRWVTDFFLPDEISRLQSNLYSLGPQATISLTLPRNLCDIRGSFYRGDLERFLHDSQQFETAVEGKTVQYVIDFVQ
jgi:hypothetical protein